MYSPSFAGVIYNNFSTASVIGQDNLSISSTINYYPDPTGSNLSGQTINSSVNFGISDDFEVGGTFGFPLISNRAGDINHYFFGVLAKYQYMKEEGNLPNIAILGDYSLLSTSFNTLGATVGDSGIGIIVSRRFSRISPFVSLAYRLLSIGTKVGTYTGDVSKSGSALSVGIKYEINENYTALGEFSYSSLRDINLNSLGFGINYYF